MLLCLDIGNTNIKAGVFEGESLIAHWRFSTQRHRLADEYAALFMQLFDLHQIRPREIRGCAIACVVPPLRAVFEEMVRHYLGLEPLMVGPGIRTGIRLAVENPREVGADRVANAVATYRLYGGPAIAIAFGTATVFDVISRDGEYLGGAIAPGILVAAEALVTAAAQLYQVELTRPPRAIGRNTIQAMQSGLILGFASMVEGMIPAHPGRAGGARPGDRHRRPGGHHRPRGPRHPGGRSPPHPARPPVPVRAQPPAVRTAPVQEAPGRIRRRRARKASKSTPTAPSPQARPLPPPV
jgi:type III pantothenate kinase